MVTANVTLFQPGSAGGASDKGTTQTTEALVRVSEGSARTSAPLLQGRPYQLCPAGGGGKAAAGRSGGEGGAEHLVASIHLLAVVASEESELTSEVLQAEWRSRGIRAASQRGKTKKSMENTQVRT